jgi:hypothetical protein
MTSMFPPARCWWDWTWSGTRFDLSVLSGQDFLERRIMRRYLVVSEHMWDDIPLCLFDFKVDAMAFAKNCNPAECRLDGPTATAVKGISIITFAPNGRPIRRELVRDLE